MHTDTPTGIAKTNDIKKCKQGCEDLAIPHVTDESIKWHSSWKKKTMVDTKAEHLQDL